MIEVVAIDNRKAEADLLRLAADFAQSRLFKPKQALLCHLVIEVASDSAPRPTSRAQLMQKRGLFRSAHYHFDFGVSLAYGFDTALLQMMHELVHIAQKITGRYQLSRKIKKINGEKQPVYSARWCGKTAGVIDEIAWQNRQWEQEAVRYSEQLCSEFMSFIYGAQSAFAGQGGKKDLPLYPLSLSLPPLPEMPAQEMPAQETPIADVPIADVPETDFTIADSMPDNAPDNVITDDMIADVMAPAPIADTPIADAPYAGAAVDDAALFADIDAMLAGDAKPDISSDFASDPALDAAIDAASPDFGSDAAEEAIQPTVIETDVKGFAVPRQLKLSVLDAKRKDFAARGLLQK